MFNLAQHQYGYNVSNQRAALTTGGPSSGVTPAGIFPRPYAVKFFSLLWPFPYGIANSAAAPTPVNNNYSRAYTPTISGGLQKAPTFTGIYF